jgi:hypothetical protein
MKPNEGKNDRMLRIILGAVFIIVAYFIVSGGRSVLFYIL